jgi:DNA-binding NarL/FixJ family response regulator
MKSLEDNNVVLVVDDCPRELGMLTEALQDAGFCVLVAPDGTRALSLAERVEPDVIVMDAMMPGMDGFETCRRLKHEARFGHVPVLFMIGLSDTEDILRGLDAGGVDYITKPITPDELVARVGVHLANARLAHSARAALDVVGRSLMALNRDMEMLWCTPQAEKLSVGAGYLAPSGALVLPGPVRCGVSKLIGTAHPRRDPPAFSGNQASDLKFIYVGQTGTDEFLFRITDNGGHDDIATLEARLGLTHRESEVLLWISQGKSNKDIGEILGVSPRTVNKHLEQIFVKLGVENRTAAAILAVRTLTAVTAD